MSAPPATRVRLSDPAELIAAVPHLLGFHPRDSLVVIALDGRRVGMTLRGDFVPPGQEELLAAELVRPLLHQPLTAVVLLIVGGVPGWDGRYLGLDVLTRARVTVVPNPTTTTERCPPATSRRSAPDQHKRITRQVVTHQVPGLDLWATGCDVLLRPRLVVTARPVPKGPDLATSGWRPTVGIGYFGH